MRHLTRSPEPEILRTKKVEWREKHLERRTRDPRCRPDSAKYAHRDVVTALERMSSFKCFYCETNLKAEPAEVDHYVEASARPELAFEWGNLYLSCHDCNNGKPTDAEIPIAGCVDPCNPAHKPEEHLRFQGECITAVPESPLGRNTIQKYRLDRPELDLKRVRRLRELDKACIDILRRMARDKRPRMNDAEREFLRSFAEPTVPFSLMCWVYLETEGL